MNLSGKDCDQISLHCHCIVCHFFAMMCNPKSRGSKFTWSRFPDMVASHCDTQIWINEVVSKKKMLLGRAHAIKTGKEIAEKMIKEAGYV
jgi:hypothetical protein